MTSVMPWERPGSKIDDRHLQRLAVIYVRQSTRQQLVEHQESTRLQYALVDRAVALGWQADRVLVIDEDLGKSGSSAVARTGFQRLVTEIGLDHVGLVLGIEMSRLARSGRDWYQLIELCALSGAVLADTDGVYDPGEYNDRLLLGLKGTMSEAELHLIKQRMWSGRLNKARRGELAFPLPSGYVRRPSGEVAFDPDEQVQTVIRLVFAQFERLGTLHGVLRYLVDHDIQLGIRLREGPDKGTLEWRRPNRMTLQTLLHNPAYAGIYAYGRRRVDPRRQDPARPSTGRVVRSRDGWHVMIPNVLPAYITVAQFETNEAKLAANRARAEAMGAIRGGPALTAGLVHCGRCNRRMSVRYHTQHSKALPEYVCARDMTNYGAQKSCQLLNSACVDAFVEQQVLAALTPAAVEVSLRAADQVLAERAELERLWAQRLERAAQDADRARRSHHLAEPENRLVVRQLEKEWEGALAVQQRLGEDYDRFTRSSPHILTPAERQTITALAGDIEGLWRAHSTTTADRKEIIRAVVDKVVVTVLGTSEQVKVTIVWAGGTTTAGEVIRPVQRLQQLSYYPQLTDRIRELAGQGIGANGIADRLQAEGFRPAKGGKRISAATVRDLMRRLACPAGRVHQHRPAPPGEEPGPDEWWLKHLAAELDMTTSTLYAWINRGWITTRRESCWPHRLIAHADQRELDELRERRTRPPGWYSRRIWTETAETAEQQTP
ncbi:recombinase family protein [Streptomyces sp. RLB1-33]|uniref:recombinase family protein n=1 Tax=Streptomyces mirabilis TaxID=68239 RepID=UPI00143EA0B3|nr:MULTISPECIES: recombinase family protein [Streptomyces]QIY74843.1 recombinase family protein [Streptomyces sp. RLB1-33]QUW83951.1 recombinase family protein [Streptomyces mirabilis]